MKWSFRSGFVIEEDLDMGEVLDGVGFVDVTHEKAP